MKISIMGYHRLAAPCISLNNTLCDTPTVVGALAAADKETIEALRFSKKVYESLDPSVLYALHTARMAVAKAGWQQGERFGVNIGSSRGATSLFELHHSDFLTNGYCQTLASPTTTLGNVSSWVAQDLNSGGFSMSHSITCSTALHGVANAAAWLQSGMERKFLVGGSEAPLTPFTIAQVKALKIYSSLPLPYPCRPLDMNKKQNTMVLGEGAACFGLEAEAREEALAYIVGIGFATETLTHSVSLSAEGYCLQEAMRRALESAGFPRIDVIITHATGTIKGDIAETNAIGAVFGAEIPLLTNNKWQYGHTYGASGALSLAMAIEMLQTDSFKGVPYLAAPAQVPEKLEYIMLNAVGFGGNAISIICQAGQKVKK